MCKEVVEALRALLQTQEAQVALAVHLSTQRPPHARPSSLDSRAWIRASELLQRLDAVDAATRPATDNPPPFPALPKTCYARQVDGAPLFDTVHVQLYASRYGEACEANLKATLATCPEVHTTTDTPPRRALKP